MRRKAFESARNAGRTSEAIQAAKLIAERYEPAREFLASHLVKGRPWRVADLAMVMAWVRPGECQLGSTAGERQWTVGEEGQCGEWVNDEGQAPQRVQMQEGFWLGQTEVTIDAWRKFTEATGYRTEAEKRGEAWAFDWAKNAWTTVSGASWRDPGYAFDLDDDCPVACISWNDAREFCRWLTDREREQNRLPTGYVYRLPAECEWEYACRAGQGGAKFWWGDTLQDGEQRLNAASDDALGHTCPNGRWSGRVPWSDGFAWVSPVDHFGAKGRNGFDLADMLGNVAEWCLDKYDPIQAHATPWFGDSPLRVARGGSFDSFPGFTRCAARNRFSPTRADAHQGFRVCLGLAVAAE